MANPSRPYARHVPREQDRIQGSNTRQSLGFQRVSAAAGDRVEAGNTWWRQVRIGQRVVES